MMCTLTATIRPSSTMNSRLTTRVGTPRAAADSGSSESKRSGFHMSSRPTSTTMLMPSSQPRSGLETETICPVSRLNRLALRPS